MGSPLSTTGQEENPLFWQSAEAEGWNPSVLSAPFELDNFLGKYPTKLIKDGKIVPVVTDTPTKRPPRKKGNKNVSSQQD